MNDFHIESPLLENMSDNMSHNMNDSSYYDSNFGLTIGSELSSLEIFAEFLEFIKYMFI